MNIARVGLADAVARAVVGVGGCARVRADQRHQVIQPIVAVVRVQALGVGHLDEVVAFVIVEHRDGPVCARAGRVRDALAESAQGIVVVVRHAPEEIGCGVEFAPRGVGEIGRVAAGISEGLELAQLVVHPGKVAAQHVAGVARLLTHPISRSVERVLDAISERIKDMGQPTSSTVDEADFHAIW